MENKENKYYPPDISEFHVGFEYEMLEEDLVTWVPQIFEYPFNRKGLIGFKDHFRVKYLDREGIESLGFEYDNNAEPMPARKEGYDPCIAFLAEKDNAMKQWQLFLFPDRTVWIDYTFNCAGFGYVFKGTIKNKSELKVILKQIGVL